MAFNKRAWQRRWQAVDSSNETAGPGGPAQTWGAGARRAQTWGSAPLTSQLLRWRTAREASTRHARVRAPHLPVSQCEVILAAVLSSRKDWMFANILQNDHFECGQPAVQSKDLVWVRNF